MVIQKDKAYHAVAGLLTALLLAPVTFIGSLLAALGVLILKETLDCHGERLRTYYPWLPSWLVRPGTQDINDILAGLAGWTVGAVIVLAIGL